MGFGKFKGVIFAKEYTSKNGWSTNYVFRQLEMMYEKYGMHHLVAGKEVCPSTGTDHVDFYYEICTDRKEMTEVKKFVKTFGEGWGRLKKARGTAGENFDYSTKEDREMIRLGDPVTKGERSDLKELVDFVKVGEVNTEQILLDNPEMFHQYGRTLEKAEDVYLRSRFRTEMPTAYWLWGSTGTGKSHEALHDYTPVTHYTWKDDNGWQDGYRQQPTVVLNDFRGELPYNQLLQMIDKWPYFVRRRNREPMPFTSARIIITSSLPPHKVYNKRDQEDDLAQLLRRVQVIEVTHRGQGLLLP